VEPPQSPITTLFNDLTDNGFAVNRRADDTLTVDGKPLDEKQLELLSRKVFRHGARIIVDQSGVFEIGFHLDIATPS
jgi:hypothetical protein